MSGPVRQTWQYEADKLLGVNSPPYPTDKRRRAALKAKGLQHYEFIKPTKPKPRLRRNRVSRTDRYNPYKGASRRQRGSTQFQPSLHRKPPNQPEAKKMPMQSQAQNAAMQAAAAGDSSLGIPPAVGKKFVAAQAGKPVGNLPKHKAKAKGKHGGSPKQFGLPRS